MCSPRSRLRSLPALAVALALGSLYGSAPQAAAQAPVASVAAAPASEAPRPQRTAAGTVRALYGDEAFFQLRNAIPPPMLQRFGACFTPDLLRHLESHHQDVERWLAQHADDTLKLPMAEGPIFFSNYEGADSFEIGRATIDGSQAEIPVSFSYTDGADTARWADIVMLRLVDGVWLLDDIQFDPQRWDHYTLRERVALDE